MQGYLKVICTNTGINNKINRIKTFISSINSNNIYTQTVTPYWKDKNCVVIESNFELQSINKDNIVKNMMLLTDRTTIDNITETALQLELGCYVSINEMVLKHDKLFAVLFINKTM